MKIAVIGVGCIGSVIAAHFADAGHEVVLVARGRRGEVLRQQGLSVRSNGSKSGRTLSLTVVETLADVADAQWVIVTVQMQQVEALIPALQAHKAEQIIFLLNVHPVPPSWTEEALGERLILGFPAMLAGYQGNEVVFTTLPAWLKFAMITTVGTLPEHDPSGAKNVVKQLRSVGLAADFHQDMPSWLASHSALLTGLMGYATNKITAGMPLDMTWQEAKTLGLALKESLQMVRASGYQLAPTNVALLPLAPAHSIAAVFWMLFRIPYFQRAVTDYAEHGQDEVQAMYRGLRAAVKEPNCPNLDNLCLG